MQLVIYGAVMCVTVFILSQLLLQYQRFKFNNDLEQSIMLGRVKVSKTTPCLDTTQWSAVGELRNGQAVAITITEEVFGCDCAPSELIRKGRSTHPLLVNNRTRDILQLTTEIAV